MILSTLWLESLRPYPDGKGPTVKQIQVLGNCLQTVVTGEEAKLSSGWAYLFVQRHKKEISVRLGKPSDKKLKLESTVEILLGWFKEAEEVKSRIHEQEHLVLTSMRLGPFHALNLNMLLETNVWLKWKYLSTKKHNYILYLLWLLQLERYFLRSTSSETRLKVLGPLTPFLYQLGHSKPQETMHNGQHIGVRRPVVLSTPLFGLKH